jgi:hypothetical protein
MRQHWPWLKKQRRGWVVMAVGVAVGVAVATDLHPSVGLPTPLTQEEEEGAWLEE